MKFDLTIKDLSVGQARKLFESLPDFLHEGSIEDVKVVTSQADDNPQAWDAVGNGSEGYSNNPPKVLSTPTPVQSPPLEITVIGESTSPLKISYGNNFGVDAEGLPWDERIHSSNKQKTEKGIWRRKRGLQDMEYDAIRAELLGQVTAPASVAPTPVPVAAPTPLPPPNSEPISADSDIPAFLRRPATPEPAPVTIAPPPPFSVTHVPDVNDTPLPSFAPPTPPVAPPPTPAQPAVRDFQNVFDRIQNGFKQGTCNAAYMPVLVEQIKQQYNVDIHAIPDIQGHQYLIDGAHWFLDQKGVA